MSRLALNWRTVTDSRSSAFFVKHTRLAVALCYQSRFAIYETRGPANADGSYDDYYQVADAATVSDADIKAGKSPKVVFRSVGLDLNAALSFCDNNA